MLTNIAIPNLTTHMGSCLIINYTPSLTLLPLFFSLIPPPPRSTLFPYTTLFRSLGAHDRKTAKYFVAGGFFLVLGSRSEEHTSELQSRGHLVCRLLLEKKKKERMNKIVTRYASSTTAPALPIDLLATLLICPVRW